MDRSLQSIVLSDRCVTVYGPSGAGKSSLVQAAVLPGLIAEHDICVAVVDGWPEGENAARWLAGTLYADMGFGDAPPDMTPCKAILVAAERAARRSERLLVIYLDQIEQLLYPGRNVDGTEALFECVNQLVDLPFGNVRVLLSLREDYLGCFRDRLRDRRRLLTNGFRVGPLTVGELTEAVCQAAAQGEPPQQWDRAALRELMLQVRVPGQAASDEAEAVAAYGQIVCRALFEKRALGNAPAGDDAQAEPIMRSYLQATLEGLGPQRDAAQRLLEEHLITRDGGRTLRVEHELLRILPVAELSPILRALERAAILRAGEHQGSRYFELGHDWLARMVNEQRQEREREQEKQEQLRRERAEVDARLEKERARRRVVIAAGLLVVVVVTGVIGFRAWNAQIEAHDANAASGFRELEENGQLASAMTLLSEVQHPEQRRDWVELANDALSKNALTASLQGHDGPLTAALWSPDGKGVLTASLDGTARVWRPDGRRDPMVLPHAGAVLSAAWSPDGKRILTTSDVGEALVWPADGTSDAVVLNGHEETVFFAAFSPDGTHVLTLAKDPTRYDGSARVFVADGSGEPVVLNGDRGPPTCAAFHWDGRSVFTGFNDGTVRLWRDPKSYQDLEEGHSDEVLSVAVSPDRKRVATASRDGTARIWDISGPSIRDNPVVLSGHEGDVLHVAWSADSQRVATACADGIARVWLADGKLERQLQEHTQAVVHVAFRPDGKFLATASADRTARLWPVGGGEALVLREHEAPVLTALWSPDGTQVLTAAAADPAGPSPDQTARVWSTEPLRSLRQKLRGAGVLRFAFLDLAGETIVSTHDDGSVRLWRIGDENKPTVFKRYDAPVTSAALSPDGKRIVTASSDERARVFAVSGGDNPVIKQLDAAVSFAAFSPDGARVVTLSADNMVHVWNADGSGPTVSMSHHEDTLTWAAWSSDGARIVTTSQDRTARVWTVGSPAAPIVLRGHQSGVLAAAFSPDGKRVVTASEDRTARIWDASSGKELAVLAGHGGAVLRAIWSPDGASVATASADTIVSVFSVNGARPPIVLQSPTPVLALRFLDNGQRLLSVASDGSSREWTIDIGLLRRRLASAHTGCVSPSLRTLYLSETEEAAKQHYEQCERSFQRTPATLVAPTAEPGEPSPEALSLSPPRSSTRPVGKPRSTTQAIARPYRPRGTDPRAVPPGDRDLPIAPSTSTTVRPGPSGSADPTRLEIRRSGEPPPTRPPLTAEMLPTRPPLTAEPPPTRPLPTRPLPTRPPPTRPPRTAVVPPPPPPDVPPEVLPQ